MRIHDTPSDDPAFLQLVGQLVDGLAAHRGLSALHLIHIENWFDHKWLEFSGKTLGALGVWKGGDRLTPPPFTPNRVLAHQRVEWNPARSAKRIAPADVDLHLGIWSAENLQRRAAEVVRHEALLWYSSNSKVNRRGAVMAYLPSDASYDPWYACFVAKEQWSLHKAMQIGRREVEAILSAAPDVPLGEAETTPSTQSKDSA